MSMPTMPAMGGTGQGAGQGGGATPNAGAGQQGASGAGPGGDPHSSGAGADQGGAPTQKGPAGPHTPAAQPGQQGQQQVQTPAAPQFNAGEHTGSWLKTGEAPAAASFFQDGNVTAEGLDNYNAATQRHNGVVAFQNEIRTLLNSGPIQLGNDLSVAFNSPEQVQQFFEMSQKVLQQPTAEQLAKLFFFDQAVKLSGEMGARNYESGMRTAQRGPTTPQKGNEGNKPIVTPDQAATPKADNKRGFGRVPSTRDIHSELFPEHFKQVQQGQEKLLG